MTGWHLDVSKAVAKFFKIHPDVQTKIINAFSEITTDIDNLARYDIKNLKGELKGLKRLRVGKYRVIFREDTGRLVLYLIEADSRGDIYK